MLGVDDDGHRPVIDQSDPHMRAETTFLHRHSPERNASLNLIHMRSACSGLPALMKLGRLP